MFVSVLKRATVVAFFVGSGFGDVLSAESGVRGNLVRSAMRDVRSGDWPNTLTTPPTPAPPPLLRREGGGNTLSVWAIAVYADFRTKENSVVVLRRIGPLDRVFGSSLSLDIEGFAGSSSGGAAVVGVAITKTIPVARQLDFKIGLGTTWQPGQKFRDAGVGLLIGASYRF